MRMLLLPSVEDEEGARQQLVERTLTESECQALARVREDDVWSTYPANEVHKTESRETTVGYPSTGQKYAEAEDEEGIDSDDASMSTDGSEYSIESRFEQDLSDFEANVSDRELDKAFDDPRQTKRRLNSSLRGRSVSSPREIAAVTTAEERTSLGLGGALNDLILRFGYFLTTEEYEDGNSSFTLLFTLVVSSVCRLMARLSRDLQTTHQSCQA